LLLVIASLIDDALPCSTLDYSSNIFKRLITMMRCHYRQWPSNGEPRTQRYSLSQSIMSVAEAWMEN
jgi:hypothetical protein